MNLDGDDYLENKSFITQAMNVAEMQEDVVMVFGRELKLNNSDGTLTERPTNRNISSIINGTDLFFNKRSLKVNFYHLSTIYKRNCAIQVGFYTNDILGADTISLMKLMLGNKVAYIDEIGGVWRVHGDNESLASNIDAIRDNLQSTEILRQYVTSRDDLKNMPINEWVEKSLHIHFELYLLNSLLTRQLFLSYSIIKMFANSYPQSFFKLLIKPRFMIKSFIALISPTIYKKYASG